MHKHDEAIATLEKNAIKNDQQIQEVTNLISRLAFAETHPVERVNSWEEQMKEIREVQRESAERLNALIEVVGKYVSGRNGGKAEA
jgi:L-lactate utilization protein LutB